MWWLKSSARLQMTRVFPEHPHKYYLLYCFPARERHLFLPFTLCWVPVCPKWFGTDKQVPLNVFQCLETRHIFPTLHPSSGYQCLLRICLLNKSEYTKLYLSPRSPCKFLLSLPLVEAQERHLSLSSHNFSDLGFGLDKLNRAQRIKIFKDRFVFQSYWCKSRIILDLYLSETRT